MNQLNQLNQSNQNNDIYNDLMNKEKNVLDTINRVIDYEQTKEKEVKLFYNHSLLDIINTFANTWYNIFIELVNEDMYKNPLIVFWNDDRKIYVGMMLVFIALFLFFVDSVS